MNDLHKYYVGRRFPALAQDHEVLKFEQDVRVHKGRVTTMQIHAALQEAAKTLPGNPPRSNIITAVLAKL